jgi:hypothetical protein
MLITGTPQSLTDLADRVRMLDRGRTMDEVIARLLQIEREKDGYRNPDRPARRPLRRHPDGVACFNYMYLRVTEEVHRSRASFASPAFVERLAVIFAEFYLQAYDAATPGAWISKAWAPLFEERNAGGVSPVQFALAGMNAHINNDLPWALLQAWEEAGITPADELPEYADFQRVNVILSHVATEVRATLESGLWRWLDRILGRYDDLVANVVIAKARTDAWRRAERWRGGVDPEVAAAHARHVGYESHLILV